MLRSKQQMGPMTIDQLRARAPSIFAERPADRMTSRYKFIPTGNVVERLMSEGWSPVHAIEQRVRKDDRRGVQKHVVRFRRYDGEQPTLRVGDSLAELQLLNSHDGTSAYQLSAGLFRLVCSNGLLLPDSTFETVRVKHSGREADDVIEASYRVIEELPAIQESVERLRSVQLSDDEARAFATAALGLKYDEGKAPITPTALLLARRTGDQQRDLWTTFNRVQENLIEGGQRGWTRSEARGMRRATTRSVTGIDESNRLNKSLWTLADEMAKIKLAA